jgi:hypothetical protein
MDALKKSLAEKSLPAPSAAMKSPLRAVPDAAPARKQKGARKKAG